MVTTITGIVAMVTIEYCRHGYQSLTIESDNLTVVPLCPQLFTGSFKTLPETLHLTLYFRHLTSDTYLLTGDQILKVNNIDLDGKTLEEALMVIKEQSEDITLTILPSEQATAHLG